MKVIIVSVEFSAKRRLYSSHWTDSRQDSVFVPSSVMEMILGINPKGRPQQDAGVHALLTADPFAINTAAVRALLSPCSPAHVSCISRQDMGQDVEPYFQEVMATVEQSVEEGSRGEGGALRGRLQQLYGEIVGEIDAGERRRGSESCKLWAP